MSTRGPFPRYLLGIALLLCVGPAVAGGLSLGPTGLLAVGMTATVAGALAAGLARESSGQDMRATVDAAWQAAAWTVGVLLVLSGTAALAGGLVTAVVGATAAVAGLAVWLLRTDRGPAGRRGPAPLPGAAAPAVPPPSPLPPAVPAYRRVPPGADPVLSLPPVAALSTEALGREWVRTTASLASRLLDPEARQALVRRRQETLDELERRDPAGFARWLAAVPLPTTDPARYLDGDAAGSDAA